MEPVLDHIQQQDTAIRQIAAKNAELENTLKELLQYLQKREGVQTQPEGSTQPQQGGDTLNFLMNLLNTATKGDQPQDLATQLANLQIDNMRLFNKYIVEKLLGETKPSVEHRTA